MGGRTGPPSTRKDPGLTAQTMPLLELASVTKTYGGIVAVDDVSFSVDEGSITSLIGPNGAGKTTAFDTICGVVPVDSGTITLDGRSIEGLRPHAITHRGVGRTFQVTRELGDMTVLENLAIAGVSNGVGSIITPRISSDERDRAMDVLEFVGIHELANLPSNRLSYGQKKLLEFASVLMNEPRLVLLDEPAGGVNPALLERIMDRIRAINDRGTTFLIVEHNMDVVMRLSHSIVVMAYGRVLLQGTPENVREDQRVLDAYLGQA
jgi:neutral amino acid transport system ATP-binding protein